MVKEVEVDRVNTEALKQELQRLIVQAKAVCDTVGDCSRECMAAHGAISALQTTIADHRRAEENRTFFERHCAENPDALDCRIYDV
ncbi:MAG: Calvin cycle protein CP12 [Oscillatoriales cyanobacterium C42_A2020_001]|nr:Calvin cycle protein CP12 [Leptolyngbyaceae cyanobacterium C42_A2020_001]